MQKKKKSSSVSARKLECPAWCNLAWKLLGFAQLGKLQLELMTTDCVKSIEYMGRRRCRFQPS